MIFHNEGSDAVGSLPALEPFYSSVIIYEQFCQGGSRKTFVSHNFGEKGELDLMSKERQRDERLKRILEGLAETFAVLFGMALAAAAVANILPKSPHASSLIVFFALFIIADMVVFCKKLSGPMSDIEKWWVERRGK